MTADAPGTRCAVCRELEPDAALITVCYDCRQPFHLNPYSDRDGMDCGDAVLGENLGLYFFCQRCLDAQQRAAAPSGPDPARARAAAMVAELYGTGVGFPAPPASSSRPRRRRRYRRIDVDPS